MSPRRRATTDEAILMATHSAVTRLGPTRLTLADVAREAGISPATIVQRFGSKRGLLLARAVQVVIGGALLQWAIDRDGKVADRLHDDLDTLLKPRHCPREPRRRIRRKIAR